MGAPTAPPTLGIPRDGAERFRIVLLFQKNSFPAGHYAQRLTVLSCAPQIAAKISAAMGKPGGEAPTSPPDIIKEGLMETRIHLPKCDVIRLAKAVMASIEKNNLMQDPDFLAEVAKVREERLAREAAKQDKTEDAK